MSLSKREIYERAAPATLLIVMMGEDGPDGVGSGVVIGAEGLAVTNYHVIESALKKQETILCFLPPPSSEAAADDLPAFLRRHAGRAIHCRVGRTAPDIDIAFLHLDPSAAGYPYIPLGDSSTVRPGDDIVCIGNPHGLVWTITDGSVSARRENAIQISAPISPGNSGGPLLNGAGELIGVNSFGHVTGQNLNFARPSALIAALLVGPSGGAAAALVKTGPPPRGVESFSCERQAVGGVVRQRVTVDFAEEHTGGSCLLEGAAVGLVIDTSFRTYASWWRAGRIVAPLGKIVRAVTTVGLPGLHVWLACTRGKPFEYVGLLRAESDVGSITARFSDAAGARQRMGMDRAVLPALRDAADRLCVGEANVVVGALGDGHFDDEASVDAWYGDVARRLNSEAEPYRVGLTMRAIGGGGSGTAGGVGAYSRGGCESHDAFAEVFCESVAGALICVGTDGAVEIPGRPAGRGLLRDGVTRRARDGSRLALYDVVPSRLVVEVEAPAAESVREMEIAFTGLHGIAVRTRLTW